MMDGALKVLDLKRFYAVFFCVYALECFFILA